MKWLTDYLRKSRLAGIAAKIEGGEPVDWHKEQQLQVLDIAMHGQQFVADTIDREAEADEQFKQQFLDS